MTDASKIVIAFKPGTTVKFKSGGPLMTVEGITPSGYKCFWFKDSGDVMSEVFIGDMLKEAA